MDRERAKAFMGQVLEWTGGAVALGVLGVADRAGIFPAMRAGEAMTAGDVAEAAGADERYVAEILAACAAYGIVSHDDGTFRLPAEHAVILTDTTSPYYMGGWDRSVPAMLGSVPAVAEAVTTGTGLDPASYGADLADATDRMNGPAIRALLVRKWLPALPDVVERLEAGARVADVGCGMGAAALAIARAFPDSTVAGYDLDERAIEAAAAAAARDGVGNVAFAVADASELPTDPPFDFVMSFDAIHDMGRAPEVLARIRNALAPGGVYLMVEPNAGDTITENTNPIGALFYGISTLYCLPISRWSGDAALGTAWGPRRAEALARDAGFTRFERLPIDNPTNAFYRLEAG